MVTREEAEKEERQNKRDTERRAALSTYQATLG